MSLVRLQRPRTRQSRWRQSLATFLDRYVINCLLRIIRSTNTTGRTVQWRHPGINRSRDVKHIHTPWLTNVIKISIQFFSSWKPVIFTRRSSRLPSYCVVNFNWQLYVTMEMASRDAFWCYITLYGIHVHTWITQWVISLYTYAH